MLDKSDLKQFENKGIKSSDVERQIEHFKNGFPFLNISAPATVGNGILKIDDVAIEKYQKLHHKMLSHKKLLSSYPQVEHQHECFKKYLKLSINTIKVRKNI